MAKKTSIFDDITKVGVGGLKSPLTGQPYSEEEMLEINDALNFGSMVSGNSHQMSAIDAYSQGREYEAETDFGKSRYDSGIIPTLGDYKNFRENRALSQPWYSKLVSGIGKGLVLAGTTFLDGTVGLVYGIDSAIQKGEWSGLWNNDFSNTMHDINQKFEEWLPNYRTVAEQNNAWYQNLGTMNFWADSFIKNLGFTVGALYSGGAWAAPLKALKLPAIVGEVAGATLSAVNEGRIEANNNVSDWKKLQEAQIEDAYQKALSELLPDSPMYEVNRALLTQSRNRQLEELDQRANSMGNGILLANTILLSYTNFKTFGKIYSGGFKRAAREFADTEKRELASRIAREGGKYVWKDYAAKEGVKAGLRTGLREGLEEMNQAWISETAGNWNAPDSPDAYYYALLDPNANIQTSDFLTAATKGFVDTYGSSQRWEEFVVGALTGLMGVPTVGKSHNASANTYLGRNKWIGLTGGLGGEISMNSQRNKEGNAAVEIMNRYADRIQSQKDYFVQSQSFINAMDRWSAENNAFEYKNAEDNDDFTAISAYARVGKLQDLRDLVGKDFENMSDEDLDRIAKFTSKDNEDPTTASRSGWRDVDGRYLSETEEGRQKMRQDLADKRDKILKNIDEYVNSVETVRAAVHESPNVSDDQINELAWLHWKQGRFRDRFNELKQENENLITTYLNGLNEYKKALEEEIQEQEKLIADDASRASEPEYQESPKVLRSLNQMIGFLEGLKRTTEPLGLASMMRNEDFKAFVENIFSQENFELFNNLAQGSMQYAEGKKLYEDLQDLTKMVKAAEQFNERYKEFIEDPMKLAENRQKQEKKTEASRNNKAAQDLAQNIVNNLEEDGNLPDGINVDEALQMFEAEGVEQNEVTQRAIEALEKASELNAFKDKVMRILNSLGASTQVKVDARTLLDKIEKPEDAFAFDSILYKDYRTIFRPDDETLVGKSDAEQISILQERMLALEQAMRNVQAKLAEEDAIINNLDNSVSDIDVPDIEETGADATPKVDGIDLDNIEGTETVDTSDLDYFKRLFDEDSPEIDKACRELVSLLNKNLSLPLTKIKELVNASQAYKTLSGKLADNTLDAAIVQYLMDKVKDTEDHNPLSANGPLSPAPVIDEATKKILDASNDAKTGNQQKTYWSPIQSMLPIHMPGKHLLKDNVSPFDLRYYKLVEDKVPGYLNYTDAQKKYIIKVGEYLDKHGAFQRIDSGLISPNQEIFFTTDKTLNADAGVMVILLTDKDGNVIGSLPQSEMDSTFSTYPGLDKFQEYFTAQFNEKAKDNEEVTTWTLPGISSHINKWMIGKVLYSDTELNIKDIIQTVGADGTVSTPSITLAVAAADKNGRVRIVSDPKKRSDSAEEQQILRPLNPSNGQAFVLLDTRNPDGKSRKYVAVPVHMATFNKVTSPAFTRLVEDKLNTIFRLTSKSTPTQIGKAKSELQDLLGARFAINFSRGEIVLSAKRNGKWETIVRKPEGVQENDNAVLQEALDAIAAQNISVHMSLKYVNQKYNGEDYNSYIMPFITTNLEQGHPVGTVSNWFSINPIEVSEEGKLKEIKAKGPKSQGGRKPAPKTEASTTFTFTYQGRNIAVDTTDFNTIIYWDDKGGTTPYKVRNGDGSLNRNAAKAAAYGYGIVKHQDMTQPYETPWGTYSPAINEFVVKEEFPSVPNVDFGSLEGGPAKGNEGETDYDAQAEEKGLLLEPLHQQIWNELTPKQKYYVLNLWDPKACMVGLSSHWDSDEETFEVGFDVTHHIGTYDMRKVDTSEPYKKWNRSQEISWLGRVLPQFNTAERLSIVDGLIKINNDGHPEYAWGRFKNGIITISEGAAMGTVYHEAFHAVSHTLLSEAERTQMYDAARDLYKVNDLLTLEENLAEDFRRYVQLEEAPLGGLVKWFRKLKHMVLNLVGKESYIDNLFFRIANGEYASKAVSNADHAQYQRDLTKYYLEKTSYKNLSQEDKELLENKGITEEAYKELSLSEREQLFFCR